MYTHAHTHLSKEKTFTRTHTRTHTHHHTHHTHTHTHTHATQYFEMLDAAGFERSPLPREAQARLEADLASRGQWEAGTECSLWVLARRE